MNKTELLEKVNRTLELVTELDKLLVLESNPCGHCGLTKHSNVELFQVKQGLGACLTRLERAKRYIQTL